jgi:hypothetical protein
MKNQNLIYALLLSVCSLTISIEADAQTPPPFPSQEIERRDSVNASRDAADRRTEKEKDKESLSDLKSQKSDTKQDAKEARRVERDANDAARESRIAYRSEKQAQKARKQADKQAQKAERARDVSDQN